MAFLDELAGLFGFLGPAGTLVALFFIFVVDAAVFPALPEVAIVLTYSFRPGWIDPIPWAVLLLVMAVGGEAVGNSALYLLVRHAIVQRGRMPAVVERLMRRWVGFLLVRDERVILLNRIAPVLPMVGAFIATCHWDFRKSLAYIVTGAGAKYALLLLLSGAVGLAYDAATARWLTFGLVLGVVALSAVASLVVRRRAGVPPRPD